MTKKADNVIKETRFFTKVYDDNVKHYEDWIIDIALVEPDPDYNCKEYRVCIMCECYNFCDYFGTVASGTLEECKKIYKKINKIEIMKNTITLNYFEFCEMYKT